MQVDLEGEVAIVTGGTKNIGLATAQALARSGATVACCYASDHQGAAAAVASIEQEGGRARAYQLDLSDVAAIKVTVEQVRGDLGDPSILVNNVALRPRAKIADITSEDWDLVIGVNQKAPFFLAQAVLPQMKERGWGRIVNISGGTAYFGAMLRAHVVASKLGIVGLSRALALETASWGVTVNVVAPGSIVTDRSHVEWYAAAGGPAAPDTERLPVGRQGLPEEVAAGILYFCSKEAAYVTGQELQVSGGAVPLARQPSEEY